jgi:hypothetical protein
MYIRYDDIISRVVDDPLWWSNGIPRYDPFQPSAVSVYCHQVALVHTECQICRQRFDVAIEPPGRLSDLRDVFAWQGRLDADDPPCHDHRGEGCPGRSMSSFEMEVLEFWDRVPWDKERKIESHWKRDSGMERPLAEADWDKPGPLPEPVFLRIRNSDQKDEWHRAERGGDFARMVSILRSFGCERPEQVAHMLDLDRRRMALTHEFRALHEERFGKL